MQPSVRICRESLLTESSRMILSGRKGATAPFSCLPARTGSGRARSWVKGLIPCGYSGQRPEPSESFSSSISTVFKVLLSLFFHGSFFIDYLTLPRTCCVIKVDLEVYFQTFPPQILFTENQNTAIHISGRSHQISHYYHNCISLKSYRKIPKFSRKKSRCFLKIFLHHPQVQFSPYRNHRLRRG